MALLDPIIYGSHYTAPTPTPAVVISQTPKITGQQTSRRGFTPRFDVYETTTEYLLIGEFPGLSDKSKLDIQFVDHKTLLVRGALEPSPVTNTPEATRKEESKEVRAPASPKSLKPTVEDIQDESDTASTTSADGFEVILTPLLEKADSKRSSPVPVAEKKSIPESKLVNKVWVSERAFGLFQRRFSFPVLVDIENVNASLEHGLLKVVVPKRTQSAAKRIVVG
jgi:HSP20 family molecular chaperone IbpA